MPVKIFAPESILTGATEPIGNDVRQDDQEIGVFMNQLVKDMACQLIHLDLGVGHDVRGTHLAGDEADLADHVATDEVTDLVSLARPVRGECLRRAAADDEQPIARLTLTNQVFAARERPGLHLGAHFVHEFVAESEEGGAFRTKGRPDALLVRGHGGVQSTRPVLL